MKRFLTFIAVGAFGGLVAALVSLPLLPRRTFKDVFGIDSRSLIDPNSLTQPVVQLDFEKLLWVNTLWGWVAPALLGILVCGGIAAVASRNKVWAGVLGALIGGALVPLGHNLPDLVALALEERFAGSGPTSFLTAIGFLFVRDVLWYVTFPLFTAAGVALACGAKKLHWLRAGTAIGIALIANFIAMQVIGGLASVWFFADLQRRGGTAGLGDVDLFGYSGPSIILSYMVLGTVMGLCFFLAELWVRPAWLKARGGRVEGRSWRLEGAPKRIGACEGAEIYLPADGVTAATHAQIQASEDRHFVIAMEGEVLVNGVPVTTAWLADGDTIQIGSYVLTYRNRIVSTPVAAEPAALTAAHLLDRFGRQIPLGAAPSVVGRDPMVAIPVVDDPQISRRHAEVAFTGGLVQVRDLDSRNGTFLNGTRIGSTPTVAPPGSRIRCGHTEWTVVTESIPRAGPVAAAQVLAGPRP